MLTWGGGIWDVDMSAMNSAQAVAWIVELQTELRNLLPSPYIISHAPVAPWFTSANDYADGSYVSIHQQVGDKIDFYNVQFYNQGADQYVTCEVSCVKTVSREGIYNTKTVFGFFFFRRFSPTLGANGLRHLYSKSTRTPACPWIRLSLASHWMLTRLLMGACVFLERTRVYRFCFFSKLIKKKKKVYERF